MSMTVSVNVMKISMARINVSNGNVAMTSADSVYSGNAILSIAAKLMKAENNTGVIFNCVIKAWNNNLAYV